MKQGKFAKAAEEKESRARKVAEEAKAKALEEAAIKKAKLEYVHQFQRVVIEA